MNQPNEKRLTGARAAGLSASALAFAVALPALASGEDTLSVKERLARVRATVAAQLEAPEATTGESADAASDAGIRASYDFNKKHRD